MYRDASRLQLDLFAGSNTLIRRLSRNLQRGVGGRDLLDLAGEAGEDGFDLLEGGQGVASGDHLAFCVERVGLLAESNGEIIRLGRIQHSAAQLGRFTERDREDSAR